MGSSAKSAKSFKTKSGGPKRPPPPRHLCDDTRRIMFAASVVHATVAIVISIIGTAQYSRCKISRMGDWSMVYGSVMTGCSFVISAAIWARHRRIAILMIAFGSVAALTGLGIDGMTYYCFHLPKTANNESVNCKEHADQFNSCQWSAKYSLGTEHFDTDGYVAIITNLTLMVLYLTIGVGIVATALSGTARADMCQFEDAIQKLKVANELKSYRTRARRNKILTKYITQVKPEEDKNIFQKIIQYFGYGADVEPVPVHERKVKIILPHKQKK